MASLRDQILAEIAATLTGATPAGARVHRAGALLREQSDAPAIVVVPQAEQVDSVRGLYVTHALSVRISVYARGPIADQAADATCVAVHAALMTDETRGGVAMRTALENTSWQFDADDADAVRVDQSYQITYNARRSALDHRP